jgi:hypothetical protein
MKCILLLSLCISTFIASMHPVTAHVVPSSGEGWNTLERVISIAPGADSEQFIFCSTTLLTATACGCQLMTTNLSDIRLVSNSAWAPFGASGVADRCGCYWHNYGSLTRTVIVRLQAHCDVIDTQEAPTLAA